MPPQPKSRPYDKMVCPECGADLTNQSPRKHALGHWNEQIPDDPRYVEARHRQALLYAMQTTLDAPAPRSEEE